MFFLIIFVDQLVPLPSIFFIGKSGTPITIVTGTLNSVDELEEKIVLVLQSTNTKISTVSNASSSSFIANESASSVIPTTSTIASPSNVVCEGDVCKIVKETPTDAPSEIKGPSTPEASESKPVPPLTATERLEQEAKLAKAKELIEIKRKQKEEEEKEVNNFCN